MVVARINCVTKEVSIEKWWVELNLDSKQIFRIFFIGLLNSRMASVYYPLINDPVWKYVREVNLEFANLYIGVNFNVIF